MHLRILAFVSMFLFPFAALAGPCTRAEADRADHFARIGAVEAIAQMGPSRDLRTSILSCDYNTFSNLFRVRVNIQWNGAYIRNNRYWSVGDLTFNFDGTNRRYTEDSASQTMIDYRNSTSWVPVVVWLLDEVARDQARRPAATAPAPSSTTRTSEVQVNNTCGVDVRLAFRWHDHQRNEWRGSVWQVTRGQVGYLTAGTNNRRIVTSTRDYLYHVGTLSGRGLTTGDNVRRIDGADYRMRRRTGEAFPIRVNLCN